MSLEYDIEQDVVSYLKQNLSGVEVEALGNTNFSDENVISQAQKRPQGYVIVNHIYGEGESYNPSLKKYKIVENYVFTIFSKNRRERYGVYELLENVRKLIINYKYNFMIFVYKSHVIHPQPIDNGIFIAEIKFEIIQEIQF